MAFGIIRVIVKIIATYSIIKEVNNTFTFELYDVTDFKLRFNQYIYIDNGECILNLALNEFTFYASLNYYIEGCVNYILSNIGMYLCFSIDDNDKYNFKFKITNNNILLEILDKDVHRK